MQNEKNMLQKIYFDQIGVHATTDGENICNHFLKPWPGAIDLHIFEPRPLATHFSYIGWFFKPRTLDQIAKNATFMSSLWKFRLISILQGLSCSFRKLLLRSWPNTEIWKKRGITPLFFFNINFFTWKYYSKYNNLHQNRQPSRFYQSFN